MMYQQYEYLHNVPNWVVYQDTYPQYYPIYQHNQYHQEYQYDDTPLESECEPETEFDCENNDAQKTLTDTEVQSQKHALLLVELSEKDNMIQDLQTKYNNLKLQYEVDMKKAIDELNNTNLKYQELQKEHKKANRKINREKSKHNKAQTNKIHEEFLSLQTKFTEICQATSLFKQEHERLTEILTSNVNAVRYYSDINYHLSNRSHVYKCKHHEQRLYNEKGETISIDCVHTNCIRREDYMDMKKNDDIMKKKVNQIVQATHETQEKLTFLLHNAASCQLKQFLFFYKHIKPDLPIDKTKQTYQEIVQQKIIVGSHINQLLKQKCDAQHIFQTETTKNK